MCFFGLYYVSFVNFYYLFVWLLEVVVIFIILYLMIMLLVIIGNIVIIIVFMKGKWLKMDIRFFLLNLVFLDLIMVIFCILFIFIYELLGIWVFFRFMCLIVVFL